MTTNVPTYFNPEIRTPAVTVTFVSTYYVTLKIDVRNWSLACATRLGLDICAGWRATRDIVQCPRAGFEIPLPRVGSESEARASKYT